jgi:hypothetical protein
VGGDLTCLYLFTGRNCMLLRFIHHNFLKPVVKIAAWPTGFKTLKPGFYSR